MQRFMMAAALVAMTMAVPAIAQVASLIVTGQIQGGNVVEEAACTGNVISVRLSPASSQNTNVNVFAITQSGPNRFRDAPGRLAPNDNRVISSGGPVFIGAGSSAAVPTGICWRNDIIDSEGSKVMVVIANGPGYTVHPTSGRFNFDIFDTDDCASPASTPGGVVWQENPDCRCATESTHAEVRRLSSSTSEEGFLRNLAENFSDPSYLYCAESPWKGLP